MRGRARKKSRREVIGRGCNEAAMRGRGERGRGERASEEEEQEGGDTEGI